MTIWRGEIAFFTGVSDPYEEPENPHLKICSHEREIKEIAETLLAYLKENEYIS